MSMKSPGPAKPSRAILFASAALMALAGCGEAQKPAAAPPPPAVTVATPSKRMVTDHDEYVGRFVAVDAVEIRARVSGYLDKVHFIDGQIVKQGDALFTIDPRPFQNALAQAQANLTQARASAAFAEADLARAQQLVRERTISEQVFEQRTQAKRTSEAFVLANEAAVKQAQLDLQYTDLRAPISGHIGDRRVSPGNLVTGGTGGNTTLLATIVSTDPIRFEFTFDEASYLRYTRLASMGRKDITNAKTQINLKLLDESGFGHSGTIDFVDNVVDRASGTIRGRAVFANAKDLFTPGMFARIQVPGSAPYEALLIPDPAVGTEQARKFVLVVDAENVARQRYVQLGPVVDRLRVIREGLQEQDRIIVNGLMRARPGQKVTPQADDQQPAPASPQAKAS
ncbi:MAG: rane fusion protein multidrug efflux system [Variibacter sp.]|nr:rane fusion protein multidrug efflux system [Variibacter sp.]